MSVLERIQNERDDAKCHCESCEPNTIDRVRFIVCAICGNKRCPHATDHRNACTNSNEVGQPGSSFANALRVSDTGQDAMTPAEQPKGIAERVQEAKTEMASWSDERKASVRLEGPDDVSWSDANIATSQHFEGAADSVAALEAQRVDAERYRWLRDAPGEVWGGQGILPDLEGAELDAAIDAARLSDQQGAGTV